MDAEIIAMPPREVTVDEYAVGEGVESFREPSPRPVKPVKKKQREISLDAPKVWKSKPTKPNQLANVDEVRPAKRETRVFDLSLENDQKAWNDIQTRSVSDLADLGVLQVEKNFCASTENWKILATIQYFEFRDVLDVDGQAKLRKDHDRNEARN